MTGFSSQTAFGHLPLTLALIETSARGFGGYDEI